MQCNAMVLQWFAKGFAKGFVKGFAKGFAKGFTKGFAKGFARPAWGGGGSSPPMAYVPEARTKGIHIECKIYIYI